MATLCFKAQYLTHLVPSTTKSRAWCFSALRPKLDVRLRGIRGAARFNGRQGIIRGLEFWEHRRHETRESSVHLSVVAARGRGQKVLSVPECRHCHSNSPCQLACLAARRSSFVCLGAVQSRGGRRCGGIRRTIILRQQSRRRARDGQPASHRILCRG